jgi:Rrf2 family protein
LAEKSNLPLPTVSKLLKVLLQSGFLVSHRGIKGGYSLARDTREISVAEIIAALEGPIGLTECTTDPSGLCDLEPSCPIKRNQQLISQVVRGALEKLSLADLISPALESQLIAIRDAGGKVVPGITRVSGSTQ